MTLHRIPVYWMNYYLGWPNLLPINLTISVTYNCNSRCFTCNIWKKKTDEFTLEEFEETFKTIGRPYWITISGGEPFLRKDVVEIVKCLYERSKPKIINIPTNGTIPDISEKVEDMLTYCQKSNLTVNLSIDGVESKHDEIRGLDGCFEKAMETYRDLRKIKQKNFTLGIHTVISKYNVKNIPEIFSYVETLGADSYITEIAQERVELDTVDSKISPPVEDYSNAIDFLSLKIKEQRFSGIPRITQAFRLEYYKLVKKTLREKRQVIPCYAGLASGQIAPNGDVWACCIKAESVGNLRENEYDFKRIWFSEEAGRLRQFIRKGKCYCPMANSSYTNMLCNPRIVLKIFRRLL